jgi:hypothetical protein
MLLSTQGVCMWAAYVVYSIILTPCVVGRRMETNPSASCPPLRSGSASLNERAWYSQACGLLL